MLDIFNQIANIIKPTNMHPRITQQKQLMQRALVLLNRIETMRKVFVDKTTDYYTTKMDALSREYADVMADLTDNLIMVAA